MDTSVSLLYTRCALSIIGAQLGRWVMPGKEDEARKEMAPPEPPKVAAASDSLETPPPTLTVPTRYVYSQHGPLFRFMLGYTLNI